MCTLIPVINPKNLSDFKKKLKQLKDFNNLIQIDLSDGHFTSWKSYSNISKIKDLKISLPFEIHFMFDRPEKYMEDLIFLKPKRIILHIEAVRDFQKCLKLCKEGGVELALAICPETPVSDLFPYLKYLNMVLILSVIPGPSGQTMQHYVLENIPILKKKKKSLKIELDGGINETNLDTVIVFGADYLAMGSAIFGAGKPMERIEFLKQEIQLVKKIRNIK